MCTNTHTHTQTEVNLRTRRSFAVEVRTHTHTHTYVPHRLTPDMPFPELIPSRHIVRYVTHCAHAHTQVFRTSEMLLGAGMPRCCYAVLRLRGFTLAGVGGLQAAAAPDVFRRSLAPAQSVLGGRPCRTTHSAPGTLRARHTPTLHPLKQPQRAVHAHSMAEGSARYVVSAPRRPAVSVCVCVCIRRSRQSCNAL